MEPSKRDYSFIRLAAKFAKQVCDNHRHGCVIVKGGRIISIGINCYDTGVHAEGSAVSKRNEDDFRGATLYVARLRKEQMYGLSAPCSECDALIRKCGFKKVVFTTNDPLAPIAIRWYRS
jgi:pyrimidine deaminase RibD-like protein